MQAHKVYIFTLGVTLLASFYNLSHPRVHPALYGAIRLDLSRLGKCERSDNPLPPDLLYIDTAMTRNPNHTSMACRVVKRNKGAVGVRSYCSTSVDEEQQGGGSVEEVTQEVMITGPMLCPVLLPSDKSIGFGFDRGVLNAEEFFDLYCGMVVRPKGEKLWYHHGGTVLSVSASEMPR